MIGATVTKARRLTAGSNLVWEVTVTPSQSGAIVIRLRRAVCTSFDAVTHQVSELIGPVAGLVICDRGHRSLHVHAVQGEGTLPLAVEDQALLVIDIGGRIEDVVAEFRIDTDIPGCLALPTRDPR